MVHPLLRQFRDRYPKGSLCANLLTIQEGIYVVRAVVTVETVELASGMAAAAHLEQAEDQARYRALTALGLWDVDNQPLEADLKTTVGQSSTPSPASSSPSPTDLPTGVPLAASLDTAQTELQPPSQAEPPISSESKLISEESTPIDPLPSELPPELLDPEIKAAAISQLPDMSGGPVDLSDIMAQTDVELRRLGWNVMQGRDYLEKTYGKRSRHELTDEELLSFLLYLETLSDPVESSP